MSVANDSHEFIAAKKHSDLQALKVPPYQVRKNPVRGFARKLIGKREHK